jgi:hypothetical protein
MVTIVVVATVFCLMLSIYNIKCLLNLDFTQNLTHYFVSEKILTFIY